MTDRQTHTHTDLPGAQFVAEHEGVLLSSVLADADIASCNARDTSVLTVEDLRSGKARVDFHPELFRLLAQPTHELPKTDDIVPIVVLRATRKAGHDGKADNTEDGRCSVLTSCGGSNRFGNPSELLSESTRN